MTDVFLELSIVLALAAGVSVVMQILRQPLIIGYMLTGVLVGPALLNAVESQDTIDAFASFGIALLLFIIGLGLNPKIIKEVGKVAVITGVGQVALTTGVAYLISTLFGYGIVPALYIAVAAAFSSTIIALKLLSDKKELSRLYGKITVGVLLVQDILATIALIVASASSDGSLSVNSFLELGAKGLLVAIGLWLVTWLVMPRLRTLIGSSQELLFIFAIAWGFGVASIFSEAGFSLEVGALAAGVALASQPFATQVGSRLRPLRDFFVVLFFVALGTHIQLAGLGDILPDAIILSLFVLIGNPIIVMSVMGLLGYTRKISFKTGLALAQISEFSLVFILLGNRLGQIDQSVVSLVTLVGLITIAISSYMIIYADQIFEKIGPYLGVFEKRKPKSEKEYSKSPKLVLVGYKNGGEQFITTFKDLRKKFLVIDYDPMVIDQLESLDLPHSYGDITDVELIEELNLDGAELIVSTLSQFEANNFMVNHFAEHNPDLVVICSADTPQQATELYEAGAAYVMVPNYIGSVRIAQFIKKSGLKQSAYTSHKKKHIHMLKKDVVAEQEHNNKTRHLGRGVMAVVGQVKDKS